MGHTNKPLSSASKKALGQAIKTGVGIQYVSPGTPISYRDGKLVIGESKLTQVQRAYTEARREAGSGSVVGRRAGGETTFFTAGYQETPSGEKERQVLATTLPASTTQADIVNVGIEQGLTAQQTQQLIREVQQKETLQQELQQRTALSSAQTFQAPTAPEVGTIRQTITLPSLPDYTQQIKDVTAGITETVIYALPTFKGFGFTKDLGVTATGKEAFTYIKEHPIRVGAEVAGGIALTFLPQLAPLRIVAPISKVAKPILKLAGTAFLTYTGFELLTATPEERPKILGPAIVDILAVGGATYAGVKAGEFLFPKKVITDLPFSKVVSRKEKVIPQLGENVKFTEVRAVSEVAELSQAYKVLGVKTDITAGLTVGEQQIVALGRGTKTGKPFALTFETAREISPSAIIEEQIAGRIKSTYTPQFISSLQEPKISILLTEQQRIPSTLRGQFKGIFGEEALVTGEAKARIRTGKETTGVIQRFTGFETPSPAEFAEVGLRRFALVSEGLVVRRPTKALFITAEDIIKAQSRRSIYGKTISQEFVGITAEERAGSRFAEFTEITFPKITKGVFKETLPKKPLTLMTITRERQILTQIAERERLSKLLEQQLEKSLVSPALVKSIGETRVSKVKVPLGTLKIVSFPKTTQRGFTLAGIPRTESAFATGPFSGISAPSSRFAEKQIDIFIPDVRRPSARITDITGISGAQRRQPITDIRARIQPATGILSGIFSGLQQLPRTAQGLGLGQISRSAQTQVQLQSQAQLLGQLQLQRQIQKTAQITKQVTRLRPFFPKFPTGKLPPFRPPRLYGFGLPKTPRLLFGYERVRKPTKFKKRKKIVIPFADYLSVTETAIRTGGRATQPRITKKAGFEYLRAVQRGQLRFPTFEQQRGLKV